jgi:hypothetical protein
MEATEEIPMAKGLLFASFDFSTARADEFHDWYDLEHVPERLRVPGFINAERWIGDENPNIAVATYDLESHGVLYTPPYLAVGGANGSPWTKRVTSKAARIMRFEGTQLLPGDTVAPAGAGGLLVASMNVDPAVEAEFNAWYNTEHLPFLGAVPGVLSARRFEAGVAGLERKYLALYHLTDVGVSRSDAWTKAARTPWSARLNRFFSDLLVIRCRRYSRTD